MLCQNEVCFLQIIMMICRNGFRFRGKRENGAIIGADTSNNVIRLLTPTN